MYVQGRGGGDRLSVGDCGEVERLAQKFNISPVEWIAILRLPDLTERVRALLVLLADRGAARKFTQREIAGFLGAARESITRVLAQMRAAGQCEGAVTRGRKGV